MNNKKLFKGALVLFASILMAVSCSSNTNPGDKDKVEGGDGKKTAITKEQLLAALKEVGDVVITTGTDTDAKNVKFAFGGATFGASNLETTIVAAENVTGDKPTASAKTITRSVALQKVKAAFAAKATQIGSKNLKVKEANIKASSVQPSTPANQKYSIDVTFEVTDGTKYELADGKVTVILATTTTINSQQVEFGN